MALPAVGPSCKASGGCRRSCRRSSPGKAPSRGGPWLCHVPRGRLCRAAVDLHSKPADQTRGAGTFSSPPAGTTIWPLTGPGTELPDRSRRGSRGAPARSRFSIELSSLKAYRAGGPLGNEHPLHLKAVGRVARVRAQRQRSMTGDLSQISHGLVGQRWTQASISDIRWTMNCRIRVPAHWPLRIRRLGVRVPPSAPREVPDSGAVRAWPRR